MRDEREWREWNPGLDGDDCDLAELGTAQVWIDLPLLRGPCICGRMHVPMTMVQQAPMRTGARRISMGLTPPQTVATCRRARSEESSSTR